MEGRLFLIVGNSGSGKDSIIKGLAGLPGVRVAKRFITREPSAFEDNNFISLDDFNSMLERNAFLLNWVSYGFNYGVSSEVISWLNQGYDVIVNVSRDVIDKAKNLYHNTKVIFVKVPVSDSINRIKGRGREGGAEVEARVNRALNNQDCDYADYVIDNSGELSQAVNELKEIIKKEIS